MAYRLYSISSGCSIDGLDQARANSTGRQLMDVLRNQPVDRVPHHVNQLDARQVSHHALDGSRKRRELGVMRARFAAKFARASAAEE